MKKHYKTNTQYTYRKMKSHIFVVSLLFLFGCNATQSDRKNTEQKESLSVIAYYSGNSTLIDSFEVEKITHIIFSFCHLKNDRLAVDNKNDSITIQKLVSLKQRNRSLKVLLSLGGWGGCKDCSEIFSSEEGRNNFSNSVLELSQYFNTDGIDLDWEYPGIPGYPDHQWKKSDKENFTLLIIALRKALGKKAIISFAAGGFKKFFDESIEWNKVMPEIDMVNIMSYDLVHGFSTVTGHHTPLYSSTPQIESADHAVKYLDSLGVPKNKMVIGAAFYGRVWENVGSENNGLFQPGKFKSFIAHRNFPTSLSVDSGFHYFTDTVAKATYAYNAGRQLFATFDDSMSVSKKTRYAIDQGLKGIMFWELSLDKTSGGLLQVIHGEAGK